LTERGRQQASELVGRVFGIPFARLFSSPVLRAQETARILGAAMGLVPVVTEALREYDVGVLEGASWSTGSAAYWAAVEEWRQGHWHARIEGGESYEDIGARLVPFIEGLVADYGSSPDNILLVGHGGLYRALPLVLQNLDLAWVLDHGVDYTAVIIAELRAGSLICTEWCGEARGARPQRVSKHGSN
jgi:broad specificity phosphatase PhoE